MQHKIEQKIPKRSWTGLLLFKLHVAGVLTAAPVVIRNILNAETESNEDEPSTVKTQNIMNLQKNYKVHITILWIQPLSTMR